MYLFLSFILLFNISLGSVENQKLTEYQKKVDSLSLYDQRLWRQLLYYDEGLFSIKSKADGESFFLAKDGVSNPRSEMFADIEALLSKVEKGNEKQHFACRFPARTLFLNHALAMDHEDFHQIQCKDYATFKESFKAKGISLVYATTNMNEPASMFGHIMLLFNQDDDDLMDDLVVSYGANPNEGALAQAYKGVFGGYQGFIEVSTFKQKMIFYNQVEQRNLWSLRLKSTSDALERMIAHLWEFNQTHFDYYYFDENCAYYNQHVLQVAYPDLKLTDDLGAFVLPSESVYELLKYEDLITNVYFFSAIKNVFEGGMAQVDDQGKSTIKALADQPNLPIPKPNASLHLDQNRYDATILKSALHLYWTKIYQQKMKASPEDFKISQVLEQRLVATGIDPLLTEPDFTNPSIGLKPHAILSGGGFHGQKAFGHLQFRPLLHTLSEGPLSYAPFSEIQFLSATLRTSFDSVNLWLDQVTLASAYSFNQWKYGLYPKSWSFDIGSRKLDREGKKGYAQSIDVNIGVSLALGNFGAFTILTGIAPEWLLYADQNYRLGGTAQAVLILYPHTRYSFSLRSGVRAYALPQKEIVPWGESALHIFVNTNLAFTFSSRYLHHVQMEIPFEYFATMNVHFF